jgi:hypothetical protein
MKKLFEMHTKAAAFFGSEDRNEDTERIVRELFYLPEGSNLDETTVGMNLRLEDFLWHLYTLAPQPTSPLKLAAHKRRLDNIASALAGALDQENLPTLSKDDLDCIRTLIEDEGSFGNITVPFNAVPQRQLQEGEHIKALPLPATNVLRDIDFVNTLDSLFNVGN